MRTSVIRHPENHALVIRREWAVDALTVIKEGKKTDAGDAAAEILSLFEFHYNNRMANRILRDIIQRALAKQKGHAAHLGDWMPYSNAYLRECLLGGRGQNVIISALELLEQKGFIDSNVPNDIKEFYGKHISWYLLKIEEINKYIAATYPFSWQSSSSSENANGGGGGNGQNGNNILQETPEQKQRIRDKTIDTICLFHRHIHNKSTKYIYDKKRKGKVNERLNEGRSLAQCAQAIIGNVLSDYHQARHEKNKIKIYDDIELIFSDAKRFEAHLGYAERKAVTDEIALRELEIFIQGGNSQFSKFQPTKLITQNAKESASPAIKEAASQGAFDSVNPETVKRYRTFARTVAPFFISNLPNNDILETVKLDNDLSEKGKNLIDYAFLASAIIEAAKVFRPEGLSIQIEANIRSFAETFSKLQSLNMR